MKDFARISAPETAIGDREWVFLNGSRRAGEL